MTEIQLDIAAIHRKERELWYKTEAPRRSPSEMLGTLTPWFIIVVTVVMYLLSAPHTAAVFDMLTPGWGWVAPLAVELSLVYVAFERKRAELRDAEITALAKRLRWLMFTTAVLTNFTGALATVLRAVNMTDISGSDLVSRFAGLPVTSQAALLMVIVMAFVVPVIAEVAGHGIATLLFDIRNDGVRELRWKAVEHKRVYQATYAFLANRPGSDPNEMRLVAAEQVAGYFGVNSPALRAIVDSAKRSIQPVFVEAERAQIAAASANDREQTAVSAEPSANIRADSSRTVGNKDDVRAYIRVHPTQEGGKPWSIDKLRTALANDGVIGGRTMIGEVLAESKNRDA